MQSGVGHLMGRPASLSIFISSHCSMHSPQTDLLCLHFSVGFAWRWLKAVSQTAHVCCLLLEILRRLFGGAAALLGRRFAVCGTSPVMITDCTESIDVGNPGFASSPSRSRFMGLLWSMLALRECSFPQPRHGCRKEMRDSQEWTRFICKAAVKAAVDAAVKTLGKICCGKLWHEPRGVESLR